ncbi:unnamed protein product, partial [marine sediment metagenome]
LGIVGLRVMVTGVVLVEIIHIAGIRFIDGVTWTIEIIANRDVGTHKVTFFI